MSENGEKCDSASSNILFTVTFNKSELMSDNLIIKWVADSFTTQQLID